MPDIKPLDASALDAWLALRSRLWPQATPGRHRAEVEELLASGNFAAWAAWRDGEAVGFLELYLRPFANGCESRPVPFLEGVWVHPSWRRRGLGRRLLETAERWARERGFTELGSDAEIDNAGSLQAHSAWGFEERERVVYFRKRL